MRVHKKLPAETGLLITEDTRSYIYKGNPKSFTGGLIPHEFPLGQALEEASFQAFSQVFANVSLVRTMQEARKFQFYIEPLIEDFHFRYNTSYVGFSLEAIIRIKVRAILASGDTRIWEKAIESPEIRQDLGTADLWSSSGNVVAEAASRALASTLEKIAKEMAHDSSVGLAVMRPGWGTETVEQQQVAVETSREKIGSLKDVEPKSRWAVIIGISNYADSRIPFLGYAAEDAKSLYEWLLSINGGRYAPFRVKLLIDKEATARNIKHALFEWLSQAPQEDMVTIYFAGHGTAESPEQPQNLFLLPYDTQYDSIANTAFSLRDMETALKEFIKAKKVVIIADASHTGGVGQAFETVRRENRSAEVNPISAGIQNLSKVGQGSYVISSTQDKQLSQESMKWGGGHGVFTYFLLKGLKGEADFNKDKSVTLGELIPYLSEQVRGETRNAQSPTVAGKFDPALTIGVANRPVVTTSTGDPNIWNLSLKPRPAEEHNRPETEPARPQAEKQPFQKKEHLGEAESKRLDEEKQKLAYIPKAESVKLNYLRKKGREELEDIYVKEVVITYNFYESSWNPEGSFKNDLVDNGDGTITDRATGLMWEQSGSRSIKTLRRAKSYVKKLNNDNFVGYSDWRLPTVEELASLLRKNNTDGIHIDPLFDKRQKICWSSDKGPKFGGETYTPPQAWYVNFGKGKIGLSPVSSSDGELRNYTTFIHARAVRSLR